MFGFRICNLNSGFGLLIFMRSSSSDWLFYNLLNVTSFQTSIFFRQNLFRVKNVAEKKPKNIILFFFIESFC